MVNMHKKTKGSIAELRIAADLMQKGWRVLLPFGENNRYDLVAECDGKFLRIQVKYVTPKDGTLYVNCRSSNNWSVLPYTAEQIDIIAVYNPSSDEVYYVPASQMRKSAMRLRINATKNKQRMHVRFAAEFKDLLHKA